MAVEHTFLGTWEIICCTFEGKPEISGLEGIKFRLDDSGDITWYNDLVSPHPESKDCNTCCDSASVLFSCETFDVNLSNPRLVFGTFAGYSIDFKTNTLTPADMLVLDCENWYVLECRRLKDGHEAGQENQFSFAEPLSECYFSDMIIKSLDGVDYCVHSSVLRLSGFDCSMSVQVPTSPHSTASHTQYSRGREQTRRVCEHICTDVRTPKAVKISETQVNSVGTRDHCNEEQQNSMPHVKLSPIYLQLPSEHHKNVPRNAGSNLNAHRTQNLSSSFNCLSTTTKTSEVAESAPVTTPKTSNSKGCSEGKRIGDSVCDLLASNIHRFPPTSSSDSHLESQTRINSRNIFNFCQEALANPIETTSSCNTRRPPLSPYRVRSPSPLPSSLDTPPSSPLTPVGVLHNLPAFILTPILNWLYTESLMPDLDEEVCEKLINFVETQPSLTRMMAPLKKYQKLILLKKYVVNIIMDLHHILDCVIKTIHPLTISREPELLYNTFKDCLRDGAVGCVKVLQFCNIFIKDAADISRNQKNEIIKYVRTRIPVFITQFYQLLKNVLNVFISLDEKEKIELVNFLVPEIETTLTTLTDVIEKLKNSLEKMCKDLNCSQLALSLQQKSTVEYVALFQLRNTNTNYIDQTEFPLDNPIPSNESIPLFRRSRRSATPATTLTFYGDRATNKKNLATTENDLKFVLYMYEVRKMRDIYGRIAAALDVIRDKRTAFCGMDLASKRSTIQQNLEQLIIDIPGYLIAMEHVSDTLEENLGKKEFKFCFKLATSQINGVIGKLLDHKAALKSSLCQICRLVRRREFLQCLVDLGLLESSNILQDESTVDHERVCATTSRYSFASHCQNSVVNGRHEYDYKKVKLNLIEHLCDPPIVANSNLSKNALRLLHSSQLTDMEFEVHSITTAASIPGVVINSNKNDLGVSSETYHEKSQVSTSCATQASSQSVQIHTFRAHRVIVSSRCEWFKMALLSGMQESITRKIIITDTSPVIFRRLLLYLYGAPIDKTVGAEQICELMLLADRYSIDDLKTICENMLNTLIDEESVVCLLGIAERYRAEVLKNNCFAFLQKHANITRSEIFKELPRSIQLEAKDRIRWYQRTPEPWGDGLKSRNGSRHSLKSPSKPRSRSRKSSPSCM